MEREKKEIAKTEVISEDRNGKIVAHPADSSEVGTFSLSYDWNIWLVILVFY